MAPTQFAGIIMARKLPDDLSDAFKLMVDGLAQTQGSGLAVYHILLELVARLANTQPDPSGFLKSMYETISAKIDQNPLEVQQKAASGYERETISTFFSVAENTIRRTQSKGAPKPPRD
jgi:hypothetical protein